MQFQTVIPQDLRTTASPTFNDLTCTGDVTCDELTITVGNSDVKLTSINGVFAIENQSSGYQMQFNLLTKDKDGTDGIIVNMWAKGDETQANTEALQIGYFAAVRYYSIRSNAAGTGTIMPLYIGVGADYHIKLTSDGITTFDNDDVIITHDIVLGDVTLSGATDFSVTGPDNIGLYCNDGFFSFSGSGNDIQFSFIGGTNLGVLMWMEDEDYFCFCDDVMLNDGENLIFNTTTGTKIGTSTSQKIGFYNATPVVQQTTGVTEVAFTENSGGTAVNVDSTFGGYTLQQIVQALQNYGLLA